jgi:hypothetical protein
MKTFWKIENTDLISENSDQKTFKSIVAPRQRSRGRKTCAAIAVTRLVDLES